MALNVMVGSGRAPGRGRGHRRRRAAPPVSGGFVAGGRFGQLSQPGVHMPPAAPAAPPATPPVPQLPQQSPDQPKQFAPDARYIAEAAQRQFARQTQLDQLKADADTDRGAFTEAVRRLMQDVPEGRKKIGEDVHDAGLFFSGQHTKALDRFESDIARRRSDAGLAYQGREAARAAARDAIQRGAPIEEAAALAESIERRLGLDSQAADAGALAPTRVPDAPARAPHRRRRRR